MVVGLNQTMKYILAFTTGIILSQNISAATSSFAYCGKKVVCQGDHTCTMIDGDYLLFKPFAVGNHFLPGTFPLAKVIVWNNKSRKATCYYSTPPDRDMVVQFLSLPNVKFGIAQYYPASEGWIYDDPNSVPSSGKNIYACDASKFECRMEHLM